MSERIAVSTADRSLGRSQNQGLAMGQLQNIDHVVVLMLENRSFDCLLGKLYPKSDAFEGLAGNEQNPDASGAAVPVWNSPGTDEATMSIPDPDPGELWTDINMQLFGAANPPNPVPTPAMSGFVRNYLEQTTTNPSATYDPKSVMHYYTPDQVPVLSTLATQFAVCDHWFASAPCQTWPNRWFVHAATADGHQNNEPPHLPNVPTIFNLFEYAGNTSWKIYFHDLAQAHTLLQLFLFASHFQSYRQFQADCQSGQLPAYSFIEPQYYADLVNPENDQHPPSVVTLGEQLIADVYNCVRSSALWPKTLLIITFDEHGGCYDHVPPPPAAEPETPAPKQVFAFDRYGVRVPAVLVSPYIQAGTIFGKTSAVPFDHTSIIATLRKRFNLGAPLTARDTNAPDLDSILTLSEPTNMGPAQLTALPYAPSPKAAAVAQSKPLNGMQKALVSLAASLPTAPGTDLKAHLADLQASGPKKPPPEVLGNVHDARNYVKKQVGNYFQSN
jgi:phospholipase C